MTTLISICLCTYRRSSFAQTIESVKQQLLPAGPAAELVVVDNDPAGSARSVLEGASEGISFPVRYCIEPRKGLAHARNRVLEMAAGDWLAMLDDDEIAAADWLAQLYSCVQAFGASAAIGTVEPAFARPPPDWLIASRLFDLSVPVAGTLLTMGEARCGNALVNAGFIKHHGLRFDLAFNETGGEDTDFFRRWLDLGGTIVSAPAAVVREMVPETRLCEQYVASRSFRDGEVHARVTLRHAGRMGVLLDMCRALRNILGAAALTFFSLSGGPAAYYRYYVLLIRNIGRFRVYLGFAPLRMYR